MAFIRKKKIAGKTYFYLVENKREGDKVRQKVLSYLGDSKSLAQKLKELLK